jgi:peptidoglycan/LPS O-acetylase OafA/YrhL
MGRTLIAFFFGAVLVLALTSARHSTIVRASESRILRFFGKYSYGMYVFHHPMLFFKVGILPLTIVPMVYGSQLPRQLVYLLVATAVSVALGVASWHLVEKPFLNLTKLFPYLRSRADADLRTVPSGRKLVAKSDASLSPPLQVELAAGAQSIP